MARNPAWVEDELLVVLDLYLENRRVLEENDPRVLAASELLNRLPLHPEAGSVGFRTPDAVVLRMANYRSYDPSTPAKGMTNAGRRAEEVWKRHSQDPRGVRDLVAAISHIADPDGTWRAEAHEPEPDETEVHEGRLIYRLHRRRERDPSVRARKFKQLARNGVRPTCEACGLHAEAVFGPVFSQVLECHHVRPLRLGERSTGLADVALLCASCHRAIHAKGLLVTIKELRDSLPRQYRNAIQAVGGP